jgi:hypothetical protein
VNLRNEKAAVQVRCVSLYSRGLMTVLFTLACTNLEPVKYAYALNIELDYGIGIHKY